VNRQWLDKAMEARGISLYKLKTEFHVAPETLQAWQSGKPARPFTLRKLADALKMDFETLRRNLGVTVLTTARIRRARVIKAQEAQGILDRAHRIGRTLPAPLKEALEQTAAGNKPKR
jgi:transcriptional regulator with XRE-family HTH domain